MYTDTSQMSQTASSQRRWFTWADLLAYAKVGLLLLLLGVVLAVVLWIVGS